MTENQLGEIQIIEEMAEHMGMMNDLTRHS